MILEYLKNRREAKKENALRVETERKIVVSFFNDFCEFVKQSTGVYFLTPKVDMRFMFSELEPSTHYDSSTKKIGIDLVLSSDFSEEFGISEIIVNAITIAHELGHHIFPSLYLDAHKTKKYGFELSPSRFSKKGRVFNAREEDFSDYLSGIFMNWLIKTDRLVVSENEIKIIRKIILKIGTNFFHRGIMGHGSKLHRLNLFMQGFHAKSAEEELKLLFKDLKETEVS
jgi:hypothetical protein